MAGLVLRADDREAYFLDHPMGIQCSVRARWGLPCPTGGITRGVALSLHGDWVRAWRIFPAAPVAVAGAWIFAAALLGLAYFEGHSSGAIPRRFERWLRTGTLAYAGTAV